MSLLDFRYAHLGAGNFLSGGVYFDLAETYRLSNTKRNTSLDVGIDSTFHHQFKKILAEISYKRKQFVDSEFRVLSEDRLELGAILIQEHLWLDASVFYAHVRNKTNPTEVQSGSTRPTYGAEFHFNKNIWKHFTLAAGIEAAQSYYTTLQNEALSEPRMEIRFNMGVSTSWSN